MGRPRCVRATCDLKLRTASSIKTCMARLTPGFRHMLRALLGSDRKNKKDGPRRKLFTAGDAKLQRCRRTANPDRGGLFDRKRVGTKQGGPTFVN